MGWRGWMIYLMMLSGGTVGGLWLALRWSRATFGPVMITIGWPW